MSPRPTAAPVITLVWSTRYLTRTARQLSMNKVRPLISRRAFGPIFATKSHPRILNSLDEVCGKLLTKMGGPAAEHDGKTLRSLVILERCRRPIEARRNTWL